MPEIDRWSDFIIPELSSKGFEKPYNADYEG